MVKHNLVLLGAAALPPDDGGDQETWVIALRNGLRPANGDWTQWKRIKDINGKVHHTGLSVGPNLNILAYDRQIFFGSVKIGAVKEICSILNKFETKGMTTVDYLINAWTMILKMDYFEEADYIDAEEGAKRIREVVPTKADFIGFSKNEHKPTVQWGNAKSLVDIAKEKEICSSVNESDIASLCIR